MRAASKKSHVAGIVGGGLLAALFIIWSVSFVRYQHLEDDLRSRIVVGMSVHEVVRELGDREIQFGYGASWKTSFEGVISATLWREFRHGILHFAPYMHITFDGFNSDARVSEVKFLRGDVITWP
jgi:hypothetical protein